MTSSRGRCHGIALALLALLALATLPSLHPGRSSHAAPAASASSATDPATGTFTGHAPAVAGDADCLLCPAASQARSAAAQARPVDAGARAGSGGLARAPSLAALPGAPDLRARGPRAPPAPA